MQHAKITSRILCLHLIRENTERNTNMDKWEYNTPYVYLDEIKDARGKKYKEWIHNLGEGKRIEGLYAFLDYYGSQGWELVTMVTEYSSGTGFQYGGARTEGYRAVFKRKLQG